MTTITRTDVHSPKNLTTENYVFVGGYDNSPEPGSYIGKGEPVEFTMDDGSVQIGTNFLNAEMRWMRNLVESSTTTRYATGHQCDHCGAAIRYVGVLRHTPTGDHLAVGETCLDGRFTLATPVFHRMRKAAELDRKAQRIITAWNAYKATHEADWDALAASSNTFIQDVLGKGRQYGDLSDKQFAAIVTAHGRDLAFAARKAEAALTAAPAAEVPEGKGLVITGSVVSMKDVESMYGITTKMLVLVSTPAGDYKVWGTVPSSLLGGEGIYDADNRWIETAPAAEVGSTVTFTANVERSTKDADFGFFSRPRKATVVA